MGPAWWRVAITEKTTTGTTAMTPIVKPKPLPMCPAFSSPLPARGPTSVSLPAVTSRSSEAWGRGRGIVAIAQAGDLTGFQQHANSRQVADAHKALVSDHIHYVVFITHIEIRSDHASHTGRGMNLKFSVGLCDFLSLCRSFPITPARDRFAALQRRVSRP